jgi:NADH:ubiquinone oxidoreductase subunit C
MSWIESLGNVYRKSGNCYFVEIKQEDLLAVMKKVREKTPRISSITGTSVAGGFEVLYHFVVGQDAVSIRTRIKRPQIRSVSDIFPGALLIERELFETVGIEPVGHMDLKPLLLDPKHSPKRPAAKEEKK